MKPETGIPIYRVAELRAREQRAQAGLEAGALMRRAGRSVASLAQQIALEYPGTVLVLVGRGNNGGDALVAATELARLGTRVTLALLEAPERFAGDALTAWQGWSALGLPVQRDLAGLNEAALVIDGLFGIGAHDALPEQAQRWIESVNDWRRRTGRPVLAIDIPSGLHADSGAILGRAIVASHTISFLGAKPGLFTGAGPDCVGQLLLDDLGAAPDSRDAASGVLNSPVAFAGAIHARAANSHKGNFGSLGVFAGARGMTGAALLCSRAALYAGTGRVYLHMPDGALEVDLLHPEIMLRNGFAGLSLDAHAAGPGLGNAPHVQSALRLLIGAPGPCVLDADALNILASDQESRESWTARSGEKVLTPHPLEAARLMGMGVDYVQSARVARALELASHLASVVVLKGAGSIIAHPDGHFAINPTGNAGLASAGTGDVLTGIVGALLAQGSNAWHAALAATWLHGSAADDLVGSGTGPIGLTASDLLPAIRNRINRVVDESSPRAAPNGGASRPGLQP
jgi:hydroxyethylthiazole kinase-like uncharacterized protein yjeF